MPALRPTPRVAAQGRQCWQGTADLIWKRLNQLFEPGFGILKYRLAVADKEDVEVEIQELAQVAPKASRVIHDALRQESALSRWVADDCITNDQDPPVPPQQGNLARRLSGGVDHLQRPDGAADFQRVVQFRLLASGVICVVGVDDRPRRCSLAPGSPRGNDCGW